MASASRTRSPIWPVLKRFCGCGISRPQVGQMSMRSPRDLDSVVVVVEEAVNVWRGQVAGAAAVERRANRVIAEHGLRATDGIDECLALVVAELRQPGLKQRDKALWNAAEQRMGLLRHHLAMESVERAQRVDVHGCRRGTNGR